MVGRLVVLLVVLVGLGSREARACSYDPPYLWPMGYTDTPPIGGRMLETLPALPSDPTMLLLDWGNAHIVDLRVNGQPVRYDVTPTLESHLKLLRVRANSGELVVTFHRTGFEGTWNYQYRIVPGYQVPHLAWHIEPQLWDGVRWCVIGVEDKGVVLAIDSEAFLYRVEWSDGQVDQTQFWPVLERRERDLSFRIVGVFSDGESVLFESSYNGPDRLPGVFADDDHSWMIAAALSIVLLAFGFAITRSRAIVGA